MYDMSWITVYNYKVPYRSHTELMKIKFYIAVCPIFVIWFQLRLPIFADNVSCTVQGS